MAQLIKLENYVSRYELDIYRYPGQFIRMKKQRWERMNSKRGREYEEKAVPGHMAFAGLGQPTEMLKKEFEEDVFFFQLRWASSTMKEKSNLDPQYRFDSWLKFFLLRFPDNYIVLYRPVFQFRQAPVELDIVMISPMNIWCVTLLKGPDGVVFQGTSDRFWRKVEDGQVDKVLSPVLSNLRTFRLISRLMNQYDPRPLPIKRVILSPASYIEYPDAPGDIEIVDRRKARQWYESMRKQPSPLKFVQLKAAGVLLRHCQTVSFER